MKRRNNFSTKKELATKRTPKYKTHSKFAKFPGATGNEDEDENKKRACQRHIVIGVVLEVEKSSCMQYTASRGVLCPVVLVVL